ncbi:MAG: hypothetical protein R3245_01030, partial [Kiloniellales bacterium]|nr:hypothetical protein [Kiloniellales bacterium]
LAQIDTSQGANKINGDSNFNIHGVIYFRNQMVDFSGNSTLGDPSDPNADPGCIQIVALMVEFTGSSILHNDPDACAAVGAPTQGTGGGLQVVLTR